MPNFQKITRRVSVIAWVVVVISQGRAYAQADLLTASIAAHGGNAVHAINTIRMQGRSTVGATTQAITISASMDGSIRLDYNQGLTRSYMSSRLGVFNVVQRKRSVLPSHMDVFAQLDMLSVLGIRHLTAAGVQRTVLPPAALNGRATLKVKAVTGRSKTYYRRAVTDDVDVQLDQLTGFVAEISRRQFAELSLDVSYQAAFRFSDYRSVNGVYLPYRIERVINGAVREVITMQNIELNPTFRNDFFVR